MVTGSPGPSLGNSRSIHLSYGSGRRYGAVAEEREMAPVEWAKSAPESVRMPYSVHRQIAGHEVGELETVEAYRPYDRLILRRSEGKTARTVLLYEPAEAGWSVTAIRCPRGCQIHRWKR